MHATLFCGCNSLLYCPRTDVFDPLTHCIHYKYDKYSRAPLSLFSPTRFILASSHFFRSKWLWISSRRYHKISHHHVPKIKRTFVYLWALNRAFADGHGYMIMSLDYTLVHAKQKQHYVCSKTLYRIAFKTRSFEAKTKAWSKTKATAEPQDNDKTVWPMLKVSTPRRRPRLEQQAK